MKQSEIKNAFSELKTISGQNDQLTLSIANHIEKRCSTVIPVENLKLLTGYFVATMLISGFIYLLFTNLHVFEIHQNQSELVIENTSEMIFHGLSNFNTPFTILSSFLQGTFLMFFKTLTLAFIFAAALMNADGSKNSKGELSCLN